MVVNSKNIVSLYASADVIPPPVDPCLVSVWLSPVLLGPVKYSSGNVQLFLSCLQFGGCNLSTDRGIITVRTAPRPWRSPSSIRVFWPRRGRETSPTQESQLLSQSSGTSLCFCRWGRGENRGNPLGHSVAGVALLWRCRGWKRGRWMETEDGEWEFTAKPRSS